MSLIMKCGHASNSWTTIDGERKPACAICAGINEGAYEIDHDPPVLKGREAICTHADERHLDQSHGKERAVTKVVKSEVGLPFFKYLPDEPYDRYYCGCWGWD